MGSAEWIDIEVVYALPERQHVVKARVLAGTSASDAIRASGIHDICSQIDLEATKLAVYGRRIQAGYLLRDGDRLELLWPLIADPKVVRRARAKVRNGQVNQ
jgi:putative ubiquitin-RnfH superfamily antitoxin RatB of RatAB toxin-antitoxin module